MKIEIAPMETEIITNWYEATIYCQFLNIDGKNDWRLPTINEFELIKLYPYWYWSSTECKPEDAWVKSFVGIGNQYRILKEGYNTDLTIRCRAVRDI